MRQLLLLLTLVSLAACGRFQQQSQPIVPPAGTPNTATSNAPISPVVAQSSFADVVDRVAPAVVTITSARRVRAPRQHPFFDDPRFREFFGMPRAPQQETPRVQQGLGSGVIVSADGYVLTNHHVIDGAEEITVGMSDHRSFSARLVGSDAPSDLAVLKIDQSNLPVLNMGNSDQARVGDVVLAIGNPLGLEQTVTAGIISAKGRSTGLSDGSFEDFLQTDAPINQGNSGGALVNAAGELIGINSQILSPTGGNIGIGFAIPVNMARNVMDQIINSGTVRRGSLGVTIRALTPDLMSDLGLQRAQGALVSSVVSGSPAERGGVREGDVIIAFNGTPVADSNALRNAVARTAPGTEVELTVWRSRREERLRVRLGQLNTERSG